MSFIAGIQSVVTRMPKNLTKRDVVRYHNSVWTSDDLMYRWRLYENSENEDP